jgi:OmpA-OmpF porin, OOP family
VSRFFNNQWLPGLKLNNNVNAEGYSSMQPWLSFDGTKLFFASDRPGGKGKMDIWVCPIDESGNAGPPVNLGPAINTPEDEVSPSWHDKTTTLYFSSDGHVGLGGLDIYKAYAADEDTIWNTPINMCAPINSNRDDSYFILQRDQRVGYFSSDRKECEGCAGGSCFRIYRIEKEPLAFSIKGKAYNAETNEPMANALLTFKDIDDNLKPFYIITDETGSYSSILREDMEFYIKAQKNKFFGDAASASTKGLTESKEFEQDFFLTPIPAGDIVIPGIEYDYNSATLRPQSKIILDSLVDFLNLNNNISIEISSHTDTRGSDEYNLKLSNERAKSVVDYLISKGIDPGRLIAQGYGETKPLISDAELAKLKRNEDKEAAHQKNRRTAFRTTKEDAIRTQ